MRPDKPGGALAVGAIVACCGLPLIASLGVGVSLAGLGLRSWVLLAVGAALVATCIVRFRRYRSHRPMTARSGEGCGDVESNRPR